MERKHVCQKSLYIAVRRQAQIMLGLATLATDPATASQSPNADAEIQQKKPEPHTGRTNTCAKAHRNTQMFLKLLYWAKVTLK